MYPVIEKLAKAIGLSSDSLFLLDAMEDDEENSWELIKEAGSNIEAPPPAPTINPAKDCAFILYTSGTFRVPVEASEIVLN